MIEQAATLPALARAPHLDVVIAHRFGEDFFQGRCQACHRLSPVIGGVIAVAVQRLSDLGWSFETGRWTCPVCQEPWTGRYALVGDE